MLRGRFATGEDTVYLNQIACKPGEEGKGAGSYALMMLCFLADRHEVKIVGYASYNRQLWGEDDERLRRWYERHGFEFPCGEWKHAGLKANMVREPMKPCDWEKRQAASANDEAAI